MLAAALATPAALATLGQAQGVRATLDGLAGELAHTANDVGTPLDGLTQKSQNASHFC